MRKLIAILLFCLMPGLALAQTAPPSVTITPPKIETSGVTVKHVAIVVGTVIVGAVLGEAIIGNTIGTLVGMAGGYLVGSHVAEEYDDEML